MLLRQNKDVLLRSNERRRRNRLASLLKQRKLDSLRSRGKRRRRPVSRPKPNRKD